MKRITALLLLLPLMAACAVESAADTVGPRMLGRYAEKDGTKVFAWPASGVEARFEGTQVTAVIDDTGSNILDITLDGETWMLHLKAGRETYIIPASATPGPHHLTLTRRSEIFDLGLTRLVSLETDGAFLPAQPPAHRFLFLGDSISVGFGAEGPDETCEYSADTGAPLRAWTALTAQAFGADWHNISISGRGIYRNWDLSPALVMSVNIDRTLPDQDGLWDHARYQPEIIAVNLGTNDFSPGDPGEVFTDTYVATLAHLRDVYPEARIYAAFIGKTDGDAVNAATNARIGDAVARRKAAGDGKVSQVLLPLAETGHVWGCSWHPGIDSHRTMADAMIVQIAADTGWTPAPRD